MTNHLTLPVSHTVEGAPYTVPVRGWQAKGRTPRPRTIRSPYCLPLKGREQERFRPQLWLLLLLERERCGQVDDPGRIGLGPGPGGDRIGGGRTGSFVVTVTNCQWGDTPAFRRLQTGRRNDVDRLKGVEEEKI